MAKEYPPAYYAEYLQLDKLLDAQLPRSKKYGTEAHDEMLFVIIHQAYELWFKQILHEVGSVQQIFSQSTVNEKEMGVALSRVLRVIEIVKLLSTQFGIMETMTPLDFLEFREYLVPASGFQSIQFRLLENALGLDEKRRERFNGRRYHEMVNEDHQKILLDSEKNRSMFDLIQEWLERTPFLEDKGYEFWQMYRGAVKKMLDEHEAMIRANPKLSPADIEHSVAQVDDSRRHFNSLFDDEEHQKMVDAGDRRLSLRASQAALLINLYRDEPAFQMPYRFLTALVELDEQLTSMRHRHATMVQRMIGMKVGTGGSSGHAYLRKTAENHGVFSDFLNLPTYYIPRSALPDLPESLKRRMGFRYQD